MIIGWHCTFIYFNVFKYLHQSFSNFDCRLARWLSLDVKRRHGFVMVLLWQTFLEPSHLGFIPYTLQVGFLHRGVSYRFLFAAYTLQCCFATWLETPLDFMTDDGFPRRWSEMVQSWHDAYKKSVQNISAWKSGFFSASSPASLALWMSVQNRIAPPATRRDAPYSE